MLKSLYIKDFIILDEINLEFQDGFSVFTGETGAGKSIMVDAIGLLCGQRVSGNLVSKNKEYAIIEGVFDLSKQNLAIKQLEESGFEVNEDIVITRIIKSDGKSNIKINNRTVNLSFVKDILDNTIDIHSQHDNQYLLKQSNHIYLLDNYIKEEELLSNVENSYKEYKKLKEEIKKSLSNIYNEEDIEFYNYEIKEIEDSNIKVGEDEFLIKKDKEYTSIWKNIEKVNTALSIYDGGFQEDFFEISKLTKGIYNKEMEIVSEEISNAYYNLEDAIEKIRNYIDTLEVSEEEINKVQERLFEINRLKRKYGGSIENILKYKDDLINKIEIINNKQEYLNKMQIKLDKCFEKFNKYAKKIHDIRVKKSKDLDLEITKNLKELMLPNATFKTVILENDINKFGFDKVEFLISMNIGEDLKPLSDVASGGELSRLMLGLKVIFNNLQGISTIIFDEIDTGVSGPVANAIGLKMKELSKKTQVFSITHLAQVASFSDQHYHVIKIDNNVKTTTIIKKLNEEEIIKELAILFSGDATKLSIEAASELFRKNQSL